jgi:hypothetical protein
MALTAAQKKALNTLNINTQKLKLGDALANVPAAQGVHVPNAAAAPTKAEFDALLTSLRNAGVIASS